MKRFLLFSALFWPFPVRAQTPAIGQKIEYRRDLPKTAGNGAFAIASNKAGCPLDGAKPITRLRETLFMFTNFIRAAMRRAHYELEEGTFYGEIPGFQGVFAQGATLEACREDLESVLEGWVSLGVRLGHELIVVDRLDLNLKPAG